MFNCEAPQNYFKILNSDIMDFNPCFSFENRALMNTQEDKENSSNGLFNSQKALEEKRPSFLVNLFNQSEEITKMTQEISNLTKNLDKRDQIRNKVYAFGSQNDENKCSQNGEIQIETNSNSIGFEKRRQSLTNMNNSMSRGTLNGKNANLRNIQPFQVANDVSKSSKIKVGSKFEVKNEYNEMKENIKCLEKLLSYQQNFCKLFSPFGPYSIDQECNQEIASLTQKIETKTEQIQETNLRINTVSHEMQVIRVVLKNINRLFRTQLKNLKVNIKNCFKKRFCSTKSVKN